MKQDRRINKSQEAIKQAFFEISSTKQFEQITVQAIADQANINRSTFYAHYYDKYDLLDKIEDDYIKLIHHAIGQTAVQSTYAVVDVIDGLVNHIDEHMDYYYFAFNLKDSNIEDKLYRLINVHLSLFRKKDDTIGAIPFDYFMSYVSGAGIALIKHWVQDTDRMSSEDLAQHFYKLITHGPAGIIEKEVEMKGKR